MNSNSGIFREVYIYNILYKLDSKPVDTWNDDTCTFTKAYKLVMKSSINVGWYELIMPCGKFQFV